MVLFVHFRCVNHPRVVSHPRKDASGSHIDGASLTDRMLRVGLVVHSQQLVGEELLNSKHISFALSQILLDPVQTWNVRKKYKLSVGVEASRRLNGKHFY